MSHKPQVRALWLILFLGLAVAPLAGAERNEVPEAIRQDLAQASPHIQWPAGFRPADAGLFAHNEAQLPTPCSAVWDRLIAFEQWPSWYPIAGETHVLDSTDGRLAANSRFSWSVRGVAIEGQVDVFEANRRLYWYGKGTDVRTYHTWLLADTAEGCHVVTEEVVNGPFTEKFRTGAADPASLHRSHDLWLQRLREVTAGSSSKK